MALKKWEILDSNSENQAKIEKNHGVCKLLAGVLAARGYDEKTAKELFSEEECLADPFLLPDMQKAVARINKALKNSERIAIYGDYDVDGMTATVLMLNYLESRGADVCYYIPDRDKEGYGLNTVALDKLKTDGVKLVITVDNGIVAIDEARYAKEIGLDLIITDHHTTREFLPDAVAVIDPFRPEYLGFAKIAGVCVAFKLVVALENGQFAKVFESYGALACLGTIADVMPIVSENRYIVKMGLKLIKSTKNPGILGLIEASGLGEKGILKVRDISFVLAPRLNAAARLNSTGIAVGILTSRDLESARLFAKALEQKNQQRRRLEKIALEEALLFLQANPSEQNRRIIVVYGEGWHHGVLGIVAAKLCDRFSKPCIVIGIDGELAKGSGRSIADFSLIEALNELEECFVKHGGHRMAVGFTIKTAKINEFKDKIEGFARDRFKIMPVEKIKIDLEVTLEDLNLENVASLEQLEPFGEGNREPQLLLRNLVIRQVIPLAEGKHVKLRISQNGLTMDLLCFGLSVLDCLYQVGDKIDAVVSCAIDHYGVVERLAVRAIDLRYSEFNQAEYLISREIYESFRRAELENTSLLQPSRDEVAIVYKCIRRSENFRDIDTVFLGLLKFGLEYGKFRIIVDILMELNLITHQKYISINKSANKCQIESSEIFKSLC